MKMTIDDTQINTLLSDICNFQLVIFGISITIFTVLYSFIISKREDLKNVNSLIVNGNDSPNLRQKKSFYIMYIEKWKRINAHIINLSILSFLIFFVGFFVKQISFSYHKSIYFLCISVFSLVVVIYISFLLFLLIKDYHKSVAI